jgi:ELWxxDGT repeat protein
MTMPMDTTQRLAIGVVALGAALLAGNAAAEEARLVADLATGYYERSSGQGPLVSLGAEAGYRFVFAADDDRHGREPWVSDGTEAGTRMLLDLCPGRCSSEPRELTRVGAKAFFFAADGSWPRALWVTDGTPAGTRRVHELPDAVDSPAPPALAIAVGDLFFFSMATSEHGNELYRSDGTRDGTRRVADRCPGRCSSHFLSPVATGQGLFWRDGQDQGIHHLDPATDTFKVFDICQAGHCAVPVAELGGQLIYHHRFSASHIRLARLTDTAHAGTSQTLANYGPVVGPPHFGAFVRSGNTLYFTLHYDDTPISWLAETDGTAVGTTTGIIDDDEDFHLVPSPPLANTPVLLLYSPAARDLHAYVPGVGREVLSTDVDMPTWVGSSMAAGKVFFTTSDGRLWWLGADGDSHGEFSEYFNAADAPALADLEDGAVALRLDYGRGFEPWRHDQNDERRQIRDIAADGEPSSRPVSFAVADGYLTVVDPQRESYSPAPPTNLFRIDDGATGATPGSDQHFEPLAPGAGGLFLRHRDPPHQLWFSRGAAAIPTDAVGVSPEPGRSAGTANGFHFTTSYYGHDIWASDGTFAGTRKLFDPHPQPESAPGCPACTPPDLREAPLRILADAAHVYWTSRFGEDFELWRIDVAGTEPLLLAQPESEPVPLIVWRGILYFVQWQPDSDGSGRGVWVLWASQDRSSWRVVDLNEPRFPTATEPNTPPVTRAVGLGDAVFFVVEEGDARLWRSNALHGGTWVVKDFGADAVIGELAASASRLYLAVATPEHGAEPWVSDGTAAGTLPLGDLYAGPRGSHPTELHPLADGRVLFAADDGVFGHEAWVTDGTAAGTRMVADLGPGAASPGDWASQGDRVLFAADAGALGRELYALDLAPVLPPCPADRLCLHDGRFEVEVAFAAPDGASGLGRRTLTSESSGVFTFFTPDNWELTVKVLDGCALNANFWVFAAATTDVRYDLTVVDRATGASKTWRNVAGTLAAAVTDTAAFATCAATPPAPRYGPPAEVPQAARICADDAATLCLAAGQRYRVRVAWETADGTRGEGLPVPYGSQDSGLFTFFSADNWELMVKVLDGCGLNGHHWLFAAGTTNVGWTLTLEDRVGLLPDRIYRNEVGTASPAIADTSAMACTP